jgi:methionyl-tRNA formyltransferase
VLDDPSPDLVPQAGPATYAAKIGPDDRRLDLSRAADELARIVRALSPHVGARADLEGRPVTVWRARVADDGSFEPIEVQPDGGRRMSADAWRRGLR